MNINRYYTRFKKRNSKLRHIVPGWLRRGGGVLSNKLRGVLNTAIKVQHTSVCENIYHCCIQKTGSVWLGQLMSDPVVYKYSGLSLLNFSGQPRAKQTGKVNYLRSPFPKRTIVSALKFSRENFMEDTPKNNGKYKVFFVVRDPRELIVSWYHSTKKNHLFDKASKKHLVRQDLNGMTEEEGLDYVIDYFEEKGKFELLKSWVKTPDEDVYLVKYEELVEQPFESFLKLFEFLDIKIPDKELQELIGAYSFETLTGRSIEVEDTSSHMRGGGVASWKKYLKGSNLDKFYRLTDSLVFDLGYKK